MLRYDYGTENCDMAAIQIALRSMHNDELNGSKSFIYGPSKANVVSFLNTFEWYIHLLIINLLFVACMFS